MANPKQKTDTTAITPQSFPEVTPPNYPSPDHSFTLQAIMEMQKSLGKLEQAVITLTEESKKNGEKIDDISHKIYGAKYFISGICIVITAVGVLVGYLLKVIVPILLTRPHP